jgi:hypothetical protein
MIAGVDFVEAVMRRASRTAHAWDGLASAWPISATATDLRLFRLL